MQIQLNMFPDLIEEENKVNIADNKGRQKEKIFGLQYCETAIRSGKYGIPLLESYKGEIPSTYTTFAEISSKTSLTDGITFFNEDYILERLWTKANRYVNKLSQFSCVTGPDFSLKIGEPLCVQIANVYRNHALAYYFQKQGVSVMPTVTWSDNESYDFCFDGYHKGGAVIVSTIGTLKDERSARYFKNGFFEMLRRISPDAVVIYGDHSEEMLAWMPKQLDIHYVQNERIKRVRQYGR